MYIPRGLIKTCPHCKSGSVSWNNDRMAPVCGECGHIGPANFKNEMEAVSAWNKEVFSSCNMVEMEVDDGKVASHRWDVVITYRTRYGNIKVPFEVNELDELAELVEAGPNWYSITDINIVLAKHNLEDCFADDEMHKA